MYVILYNAFENLDFKTLGVILNQVLVINIL